jgi:hypothetical protein
MNSSKWRTSFSFEAAILVSAFADFSAASVILRLGLCIRIDVYGGLIWVVVMRLLFKSAPALPLAPGVLSKLRCESFRGFGLTALRRSSRL